MFDLFQTLTNRQIVRAAHDAVGWYTTLYANGHTEDGMYAIYMAVSCTEAGQVESGAPVQMILVENEPDRAKAIAEGNRKHREAMERIRSKP